jgi:hypothetical protein
MRYLLARRKEDLRETGYRIYISDSAKIIAENTARLGGGTHPSARWADAAFGRTAPEDDRPAGEIVAEIAGKAGIIINHEHF